MWQRRRSSSSDSRRMPAPEWLRRGSAQDRRPSPRRIHARMQRATAACGRTESAAGRPRDRCRFAPESPMGRGAPASRGLARLAKNVAPERAGPSPAGRAWHALQILPAQFLTPIALFPAALVMMSRGTGSVSPYDMDPLGARAMPERAYGPGTLNPEAIIRLGSTGRGWRPPRLPHRSARGQSLSHLRRDHDDHAARGHRWPRRSESRLSRRCTHLQKMPNVLDCPSQVSAARSGRRNSHATSKIYVRFMTLLNRALLSRDEM